MIQKKLRIEMPALTEYFEGVVLHYLLHCSLLKEAAPLEEKRVVEMGEERMRQQHYEDDGDSDAEEADERKLLSRYGIWLTVEL